LASTHGFLGRQIVVLDAPSNLGLRPLSEGTVPGCYKLAGAVRDQGFVGRIHAEDAGYLTPPRYDRGAWQPGDGVFHAAAIASYSTRLAERLGAMFDRPCGTHAVRSRC